jgi:chromosomal replication initiation ATPase DnaA
MSNEVIKQLSPYVIPGLVLQIKGNAEIDEVIKEICWCYNIEPGMFHNKLKSNERRYVVLRQVYFYIMRRYSDFSLVKIGATLTKNHATVLHSISQVENGIRLKCKDFYPVVLRIERNLSLKFKKYER